MDCEKSYAVISFKIFNALCREKKWKNWKRNFLYWLNKAALTKLRRWTQCSSHSGRKLSNEELMQIHEEFGFPSWYPRKDCYNKEALLSDLIQTFYSQAIIKVKKASMRFENISPSKALFKNEINNEHTSAQLYIKGKKASSETSAVWLTSSLRNKRKITQLKLQTNLTQPHNLSNIGRPCLSFWMKITY